jgi:hypothetical protein
MFMNKNTFALAIASIFALATTAAQAGPFDKADAAFKLVKDTSTTAETVEKDSKGVFGKSEKPANPAATPTATPAVTTTPAVSADPTAPTAQ